MKKRAQLSARSLYLLATIIIFGITSENVSFATESQSQQNSTISEQPSRNLFDKRINRITVEGNVHVSQEAILSSLPFKEGEVFNPLKTSKLIRSLYNDFRRFRNITIMGEDVDDNTINLYIIVEEKTPLKNVIFRKNRQLTETEIKKKVNFDVPAIDDEELKKFAHLIKKLYVDKGYHLVKIDTELEIDPTDGKGTAIFTMHEPKKSYIRRINFVGNTQINSKTLRKIILSREDWVLGMLDHSGTYHPERLEADRHYAEQYYQSCGFMNGKILDVKVDVEPSSNAIDLTFFVDEGPLYTIKEVHAPGNEILSEEQLLSMIQIQPGQVYSRQGIVSTMQNLEHMWNNHGYMYAHVEPSIIPDDDNNTVNISFISDIGGKVKLRKITIKGHRKTKDKIIRRQIYLNEGDTLTDLQMEQAKNRIESLGYFEQRDGVNWKITRLSEDEADLDLILQEAKTGRAFFKMGLGGTNDIQSPLSGLAVELDVADTNLFGSGIQLNLAARLGKDERSFVFSLAQPWLFDRPIFSKIDAFYRKLSYDDLHHTRPINEVDRGGSLTLGFMPTFRYIPFMRDSFVRFNLGIESIRYEQHPVASVTGVNSEIELAEANVSYQFLLNKFFMPGEYLFLTANTGQDFKNHPMHPTRGHIWNARGQIAVPTNCSCLGFGKFDLDAHWWTPLIGEYDLVFHLHGYFGVVHPLGNNLIPYRELFHIGGPASVRGFLFGQIGPQFSAGAFNDSIGGSKTVFINAELLFPITPDFNMKALFFYDGGAGWDNPYAGNIPGKFLRDNSFDYRHSIGFGVRLMNPMPIKIDWGFKIDPRRGETAYEVHFGTAYEW